ncbi:unnamed protein product, partial [Prorocentrum cordatum]
EIIPNVMASIRGNPATILQAPTGAGKTTIVPLAVLDTGTVQGKVLVLQPRRITCVSVARRMAFLSGEPLGEFVGYRIRHDVKVSNRTRIEVVTEGVLLRLLQQNPSLEGYGAIFFDEFHERNLDSDLSFSMCLAAQRARNLQFKLVVMSATFGTLSSRLSEILKDADTVVSEGTTFPVEVVHRDVIPDLGNWDSKGVMQFAEDVAGVVRGALDQHAGDVLVFLPGEREIMYTWIALNNLGVGDGKKPSTMVGWASRLIDESAPDPSRKTTVCTLYATMDDAEQDESLAPPPAGWRKVILATPIAESSITVPNVRIVVDAGLKRVRMDDPLTCTNRMVTVPVSVASADQRKGRAGRVSEGVCYRLWSEQHHRALEMNDTPEIHRADLTSCVLELAIGGYLSNGEIAAMPWVDAPTVASLDVGREILARMQGLERQPDGGWALTERGRGMARFPVHPRLGHAILQAMRVSDSFARDACDLAALMEERELLRGGRVKHGADLGARLDALQATEHPDCLRAVRERVLLASEQLQRNGELSTVASGRHQSSRERRSLCVLLAWAFPELLAEAAPEDGEGGGKGGGKGAAQAAEGGGKGGGKGSGKGGAAGRGGGRPRPLRSFRVANGGVALLHKDDPLATASHIAIASLSEQRVFWALEMEASLLEKYGVDLKDPKAHEVYPVAGSFAETNDDSDLPVTVQRYLVGKDDCKGVDSSEALLSAMEGSPGQFPTGEVRAMMWDLAWVDPPQTDMLRNLARQVVSPRAGEFKADELAHIACSLAVARVYDQDVFDAIAAAVTPRINDLELDNDAGNLCSLLWAFTEVGASNADLFAALAERAVVEMRAFRPAVLSDVRNTCFWCFKRASAKSWSTQGKQDAYSRDFAHGVFFEALSAAVLQNIDELSPITCVYLMWSFSKARVHDQELFDAVERRVGRQ